ncbi:transmembrane emp24 domain-containing protein 5-like [Centruroides sculpturatus]|uniref:transmembrane emp24 domain-containing protein 5-like n=1 Tax=Centruroides sculpturatus TaxID=218467 RepID=UPI000C6D1B11|nr:transmembrane emp24 domain-containing protein 5-like [Centruroides sculpturatus]
MRLLYLINKVLDTDYENIDTKNKLEISFALYSPQGKNLISETKKSDGIHRYDIQETGDYKFCFDNKFSHFSTKTVYFDIFIDSDDDDDDEEAWNNPDITFQPDTLQNDTLSQIKQSINNVRDKLNQIQHFQNQRRSIGTRRQNIQEHNHSAINTFSIIIIITMFLVGSVQVIMVRSLFEEKSKLHKIFKLLS